MNQELVVPAAETDKKLQTFLKNRFPIGYVRKLFRRNGLRVNGKRSKPDYLVAPAIASSCTFHLRKPSGAAIPLPLAPPKFSVIYEDPKLLVVNKPAGIAVHEGKRVLKRHSLIGVLETDIGNRE